MEFGKNVINIRVDNSSLVHVDNKKKNMSRERSNRWIR